MQSSTLALLLAHGFVRPMVDCAIFADTAAEPANVYTYLNWLETQLPFPVYRVMKSEGGLRKNIIDAIEGGRFAGAPFFTESATGGREGRLRRQCTREFKVEPITQRIRQLMGLAKGQRAKKGIQVVQYLGISTDEASRMKPSREHYIEHRWPLIELGMSRLDCLKWMEAHGYPKPRKSACTFCPYHDDKLWADMKANDPLSFADAVDIDRRIRAGVRGTTQKLYVHRSMKPLEEVDFRTAEEAGQSTLFDDFDNECEGMCGL